MTRKTLDAYMTPPDLARFCVGLLAREGLDKMSGFLVGDGPLVLEPACGTGNFVRAIKGAYPGATVRFGDIDAVYDPGPKTYPGNMPGGPKSYPSGFKHGGFFDADWKPGFDAVVGNPPYRLAEQFIRHSLDLVRVDGVVAYVLRTGFLASAGRLPLFSSHPPKRVYMLAERPSFTDDGRTDSYTYCWIVWRRGWRGPTELEIVSWRTGR